MKKVIRLNEADLEKLVKKVIKEHEIENSRYMFFSNLEQMRRQCDMLLEMDPNMLEGILQNGHDWAQDHIAEAKNNMDQVFDFLMNESKEHGMELSMDMYESFFTKNKSPKFENSEYEELAKNIETDYLNTKINRDVQPKKITKKGVEFIMFTMTNGDEELWGVKDGRLYDESYMDEIN
jgi:hypothetical protein